MTIETPTPASEPLVPSLLVELATWMEANEIGYRAEEGQLYLQRSAEGIDFEVVFEELPGILVGFIALLEPLEAGDDPAEALAYLASVAPIPVRYREVAAYWVDNQNTPGLYLRLRMPLRFAAETALDAMELIVHLSAEHARAQAGQ